MPLDSNGIWTFEEADSAATMSDLLNIGQDATSARVADLSAQLDTRQAIITDTGDVTAGIFASVDSNWIVGNVVARRWGPLIRFGAQFTYNGPDISIPTSGNITNSGVGVLTADWCPGGNYPFPLETTNSSPAAMSLFTVWNSGTVRLDAVASAGAAGVISAGQSFNVGGNWMA